MIAMATMAKTGGITKPDGVRVSQCQCFPDNPANVIGT
jgi:hypothetical protein